MMMDILMSETCWAHKKWNKIASDIKLVFYSSTQEDISNRTFYKNKFDLISSQKKRTNTNTCLPNSLMKCLDTR